jgi:hypothetical protein
MLRKFFPRGEKRSYNDLPPKLINIFFKNILFLEAKLIQKISLPFGVAMVILAQKPYHD